MRWRVCKLRCLHRGHLLRTCPVPETPRARLEATPDFLVVGAYPPGQERDICRQAPDREAVARMAALPFPPSDPVWGKQGALLHLWRLRERRCGPLPKRLGWKSGRIHAYALLSEIRDQAVAGDVANPIPTLPSRKSSQSLVALQRFAGGDETSVLVLPSLFNTWGFLTNNRKDRLRVGLARTARDGKGLEPRRTRFDLTSSPSVFLTYQSRSGSPDSASVTFHSSESPGPSAQLACTLPPDCRKRLPTSDIPAHCAGIRRWSPASGRRTAACSPAR